MITTLEFYRISGHLQGFASLAILLIAMFSGQITFDKKVRTLALYGGISFLFYLGQKLAPIQYINLIGDFFVLFETSVLLFLYYLLNGNKWTRILLSVVTTGFFILFISYLLREEKGLGSDIRSFRDVAMILFSVITFIHILNNLTKRDLTNHLILWINSAVLFFFSCTLMLSLSMTYIAEVMRDDFAIFWAFRNFLRALFCLVICIGIWKARKSAPA